MPHYPARGDGGRPIQLSKSLCADNQRSKRHLHGHAGDTPPLLNCPAGGQIIGNAGVPTSVSLNDSGTNYTITASNNSNWLLNGVSIGGTYGGISALPYSQLLLENINWGGALAQFGLNVDVNAFVVAGASLTNLGATFTISATSMGTLLYSRGVVVFDASTITVQNNIALTSFFVGLDASTSFFALDGTTITLTGTVTPTSFGLIMSNGAFLETNSSTKVGAAIMSRANFPGEAVGMLIDATSRFMGDTTANCSILGEFTGSNSIANCIALNDATGNLLADQGVSQANAWTFQSVAGSFNFKSANTQATAFIFENTSTGGHNDVYYTSGSAGSTGVPAGGGGMLDSTTGNNAFWWDAAQASFNIWSVLGWGASSGGSYTVPTIDTGISRLGAANVALGNGTAGDFSGTLKLAHITATALANAAGTDPVCYSTATGVFTWATACTISDERLKNIGPRIDDALNKLLQINGFYFTYKDADKYGTGRKIGVGAQTVEKVFPELVETGSDGIKSVDYAKLVPPIIEALRELKADNDNLRACQESWKCRLFGSR